MKPFISGLPRKIVFGRGCINDLPSYLGELGLNGKAMLVTGRRFARESGYLDKITSLLKSSGIEVVIFDRVEPNPLIETVESGGRLAREKEIDFVIGFGGGSAMDAAKGIAVLASHGGRLEDYFYPAEVKPLTISIVEIATTCGTGSEVTKYAVFSRGVRKYVIASDNIVPTLSILDAEVLKHLPKAITAHTAMDAFSHALEAYYHVKSSQFSEIFIRDSIKIIFENFERGVKGDLDARERLLYASMLAGLAITMSGTIVVHGLGYYLTQKFNIPHGLANALFLNQFIEYAANKIPERTLELGNLLGLNLTDPKEISKFFIKNLNKLKKAAELPMSLAEAGVPESEIPIIVEQALSYKRNLENCIKPPTPEEVEELVKRSFRG